MAPYQTSSAQETDIAALMLVSSSAFLNEPYQDSVYPLQDTAAGQELMGQQTLLQWRQNPNQHVTKCVDVATGRIVGLGIWSIYDQERGPEEWRQEPDARYLAHLGGEVVQRAELFLRRTAETRWRIWEGRRVCLLSLLCIHADHQCRGAGTSLVQWGLDRADQAGIPAYLEASIFGRPLYRKFGFREVESEIMVVKAEEYGGDVDSVYMPMVRPVPGSQEDPLGGRFHIS